MSSNERPTLTIVGGPAGASNHSRFDSGALARAMESTDAALLTEMYLLFLDQARDLLAQIDGHLGRRDYRLVKQIAHRFKSSAYTVGANEVAAIITELESASAGRVEATIMHCTGMLHHAVEAVEKAIHAEVRVLHSIAGMTAPSGEAAVRECRTVDFRKEARDGEL